MHLARHAAPVSVFFLLQGQMKHPAQMMKEQEKWLLALMVLKETELDLKLGERDY